MAGVPRRKFSMTRFLGRKARRKFSITRFLGRSAQEEVLYD